MKKEDIEIDKNSWPKDATSPQFLSKLRRSIEGDLFWAGTLYPIDLARRLSYLLAQLPVEEWYERALAKDEFPMAWHPSLTFIDMEHELDLKRLHYDADRYVIYPRQLYRESVLDHFAEIYFRGDRTIRLNEFVRHQINNITFETLMSQDLLDQVLILSVIKDAQQGQSACINKLVTILQPEARKIAHNFVSRWLRETGVTPNSSGALSQENVKSVADSVLYLLIRGDPTHTLLHMAREKEDVSLQLNRKLQQILLGQLEKLPIELAKYELLAHRRKRGDKRYRSSIIRKLSPFPREIQAKAWGAMLPFIRDFLNKGKNRGFDEIVVENNLQGDEIVAAKHISEWFSEGCRRKAEEDTFVLMLSTIINPYVLITSHPAFNSMLFKPNKTNSFMLWLFGKRGARDYSEQGAFQRKLNDWLKSLSTHKKDSSTGKTRRLIKDEHVAGRQTNLNTEILEQAHWDGEEFNFTPENDSFEHYVTVATETKDSLLAPDQVIAVVQFVHNYRKDGASSRNCSIVLMYCLRKNLLAGHRLKVNQKILSEQYRLSARQVRRIVDDFEAYCRHKLIA